MTQSRHMRRVFTAEFKHEAVRLLEARRAQGGALTGVARELGVRPGQLREWAEQAARAAGAPVTTVAPNGETLEQEVRRLRREVSVLRQEAEFAKKAAAFFARESR